MDAKISHHGDVTTLHTDSKSEISGKPKDTAVGWLKTDDLSDETKSNREASILSGLRTHGQT
jgi:hypothetical protein